MPLYQVTPAVMRRVESRLRMRSMSPLPMVRPLALPNSGISLPMLHRMMRGTRTPTPFYVWLAKRSVAGAGHWYRAFLDAAASLYRNPSRYGLSA